MPNNDYDYAVFIGRFQPFHIGHLHVINKALAVANQLLLLIGSSDTKRTARNPFSYDERVSIIQSALPEDLASRITFLPIADVADDEEWVRAVTESVDNAVNDRQKRIALIGHNKDDTTYYLKLFPQWAYMEIENLDNISATTVRTRYFRHDTPEAFDSPILPAPVIDWLRDFACTDDYQQLKQAQK